MNPALAPLIVEGLLSIVAAAVGVFVGKKGKPYGRVKLAVHVFFFAWLAVGMVFIAMGTLKAMSIVAVPVAVMVAALLALLVDGVRISFSKDAGKPESAVHKVSAIVMLLADICALLITALR